MVAREGFGIWDLGFVVNLLDSRLGLANELKFGVLNEGF